MINTKGLLFTNLIIAFLFLNVNTVFAQTARMSGKVIDEQDKSALTGAHVRLADPTSQSSVSVVTDKEGSFIFTSLRNGRTYELTITHVGYESHTIEVRIDSRDKRIGNILVKQSVVMLQEVEVAGLADRVEQKGDTTIYNADAFKTAPDAVAEDLIRKMPGITVEGGTVRAQGEEVRRILVDGRRFFGDDPNMALRNLPAEIIERVQVFDELSDQAQFTGFDDGESVRTINFITRNRFRDGQFGRFSSGYGYYDKYSVGGVVNLFKDRRRLTFIGQTNNINQQNFSNEDLMGVMGGSMPGIGRGGGAGGRGGARGGMGGGSFGGGGGSNFLVGSQNGITKTSSFGINYSGRPSEKLEVSGSYFFNRSNNERLQNSFRSYFLTGMENIRYLEDNTSQNINMNHRLNMRVEYTIDSSNSVIFTPSISFQGYDSERTMIAERFAGMTKLSDTLTNTNSFNDAINLSGNLVYRHRFNKPRRTVSLNLRTGFNNREGEQLQLMGYPFYGERPPVSDTTYYRQRSDNASGGYNLNSNINFTEPVGERAILQMSYGASYSQNNSDRYTYRFIYDEVMLGYYEQDSLFSNVFTNDYLTQQLGIAYRYNKNPLNLTFGVDQQWAKLAGDRVFPVEYSLDKTYKSILPTVSMNYRFENRRNLLFRYRTRTNSPSIANLQDVIDNSNPTRLSRGNPALEQDYRHDLYIRYGGSNNQKATSFFVFLGGGIVNNYITRATTIAQRDTLIAPGLVLPRFGELREPVNLNGYWNLRTFSTYGMPVKFLKSNLNLNASVNYSRVPGMINSILNYSKTIALGSGFTLSSNISENVDFTLSTMANYNFENNTIQTRSNYNYWSQRSSARLSLIFLKNMVFRSDMAHQLYSGLSEGYDQSYYVWNMSLARKVFKKKNGEFRLSVIDVLNNNQNISRNVTESYFEDVTSNVLTRYAMFSFIYNIRNFK